jgi:putative oxidoreductase
MCSVGVLHVHVFHRENASHVGLRVLLGLFFIATGGAKLVSAPHDSGLQGNRAVVTVCYRCRRVGGGLLLLIPRTGFYAGLLLCAEMVCAVAVHLFLKVSGTAVPAVGLVILCGFIDYYFRPPGLLVKDRTST